MFFFAKICKMNEIGIPWWFRTLRSTSSSKIATGNTFLGFRKLVNTSLSTLPEGSPLVSRLKSARSPSGRPTQSHSGEGVVARTVSRQTTRRLYQTQNFDKLFVVLYRQALSLLLFCLVPVLRECSKRLLVRIRSFYKFQQKITILLK